MVCHTPVVHGIEEVLAVGLALANAGWVRSSTAVEWCFLEEEACWEKIEGQELPEAPKARRSWDIILAWSLFIANTSIY